MFVLTIDQRNSRIEGDRVPALLDTLREACAQSPPVAGFERTVGDEVQGLFTDPRAAAGAMRAVIREGGWHLGVGVGNVDGVPTTVREGRGSAFLAAREAVDAAKLFGDVAVRGGHDLAVPSLALSTIEVMCQFVASLVADRTMAQRQAVRAFDSGLSGREVARELGVSASAISQRRTAAEYDLEMRGWKVLEGLMVDMARNLSSAQSVAFVGAEALAVEVEPSTGQPESRAVKAGHLGLPGEEAVPSGEGEV